MAQHLKADLDEIVFESRERRYGAYFLRKKYPRHLISATVLIGSFALLGVFGPLVAKNMGWIVVKEKGELKEVVIDLKTLPLPPALEEDPPEPVEPPKPPEQEPIKTTEFVIPEPAPEELVDDTTTIVEIEKINDAKMLGFENVEGKDDIPDFTDIETSGDVPLVIVDTEPKIDEFVNVSEEPKPINMVDIKKLVGYPQTARDAGIDGQVVVRILVNKKGKYEKHKIIKSDHPLLSEPVEKHISKLVFSPAIQGNKPIKFWVNIPFNFILQN